MTIAEVVKKYNLTQDTLRYYERIGLLPKVERTTGGIRNYSEEDCRWVYFIKCMRNAGLPVDALVKYVSLFQQGDETSEIRKQILIEQRNALAERINELQESLSKLDYKIENYNSKLRDAEKKLQVEII